MDCNMFVNNFLFVIMFTSFLNLCLYVTVSQYTSGEMICQHLFLIKKNLWAKKRYVVRCVIIRKNDLRSKRKWYFKFLQL